MGFVINIYFLTGLVGTNFCQCCTVSGNVCSFVCDFILKLFLYISEPSRYKFGAPFLICNYLSLALAFSLALTHESSAGCHCARRM